MKLLKITPTEVVLLWTGLLTNPMEQCPWEASSHSASQEIPCLLGNQQIHSMFTRAHHWSLHSIPRLHVIFCNKLVSYCEELLAPCPTPKLKDHPLSSVHNCLFSIFTATLHIWKPSWNFTYDLKVHNDFKHLLWLIYKIVFIYNAVYCSVRRGVGEVNVWFTCKLNKLQLRAYVRRSLKT